MPFGPWLFPQLRAFHHEMLFSGVDPMRPTVGLAKLGAENRCDPMDTGISGSSFESGRCERRDGDCRIDFVHAGTTLSCLSYSIVMLYKAGSTIDIPETS